MRQKRSPLGLVRITCVSLMFIHESTRSRTPLKVSPVFTSTRIWVPTVQPSTVSGSYNKFVIMCLEDGVPFGYF